MAKNCPRANTQEALWLIEEETDWNDKSEDWNAEQENGESYWVRLPRLCSKTVHGLRTIGLLIGGTTAVVGLRMPDFGFGVVGCFVLFLAELRCARRNREKVLAACVLSVKLCLHVFFMSETCLESMFVA